MSLADATNRQLTLLGVTKSYGLKSVLADVSLSFQSGIVHVVHGPNGIGKSTLLKLMAGLLLPDAGEILLKPASVKPSDRLSRSRFSFYQPSLRGLWPHLTVGENWLLNREFSGLESAHYDRRHLDAVDEFSNGLAERLPDELSVGLRQAALIVRTLLKPAEVYLLDEPFGHLDNNRRALLERVLKEMVERGACVIVACQSADADTFGIEGSPIDISKWAVC